MDSPEYNIAPRLTMNINVIRTDTFLNMDCITYKMPYIISDEAVILAIADLRKVITFSLPAKYILNINCSPKDNEVAAAAPK